MSRTLFIIAPLGEPHRRPRLEKLLRLTRDLGLDIHYRGWRREENERAVMPGLLSDQPLLVGGGRRSRSTLLMYPLWTWKVFRMLLREKPKHVYCLGLETATAAFAASFFYPVRYVFDDADRLLLLFNIPGALRGLLEIGERMVSRKAARHIIPGPGRYPYRTPSMAIIRNVPDKEQVDQANALTHDRADRNLRVYINGWIDPTRGSSFLAAAARKLLERGAPVEFLIAAKSTTGLDDLAGLPNVTHLGSLTQVEALSWYRATDLVATFYDPRILINQWAEANKWGDCVTMQTPFVVNEEVRTAQEFLSAGAAFSVPFNDSDALADLLVSLQANPDRLAAATRALETLAPDFPYFNDQMRPLIAEFVAS